MGTVPSYSPPHVPGGDTGGNAASDLPTMGYADAPSTDVVDVVDYDDYDDDDCHRDVVPTNELRLPIRRTHGGGMDERAVGDHRDEFYLRLSGGAANASTISAWRPPPNSANWKSRDQLDAWMDIVVHWNTGKDGLDARAYRSRHKTFYSRMKPASCNLGRRTGMHLREAVIADGASNTATVTATVLCRYNKAGNGSILYLAVDQLFDALFELHSLELSHRGRDATKAIADERYANVPDATIRAFLDTCPVCAVRRGHHNGRTIDIASNNGGGDSHFDIGCPSRG
ncbi:hypothetical protein ACHAXA_005212 [Cyclostephanos tholiformis]|uniref:Integrase zinc-binding domain-containing protein n=1 Tax=Cyclostephanos tholiformis TaxID=382380 RepID=A0ABD3SEP9_9STRA